MKLERWQGPPPINKVKWYAIVFSFKKVPFVRGAPVKLSKAGMAADPSHKPSASSSDEFGTRFKNQLFLRIAPLKVSLFIQFIQWWRVCSFCSASQDPSRPSPELHNVPLIPHEMKKRSESELRLEACFVCACCICAWNIDLRSDWSH